jgi:Bacterial SH3 domain
MKKLFIILCLCIPIFKTHAQEEDKDRAYASISNWNVGKAFTLVSDANVREKPNTQSPVLSQLAIGSEIKIEKATTDSFTLNGFRAPWCQISYDNGKKKGYLWGGFIATVVLPMRETGDDTEGVVFLGGVGAWDAKKFRMTMQLRAAKNGKELSKIEFVTPGDLGYNCTLKKEAEGGLKKVSKILTFTTGYEACGYPWGDNLIFFTKDKKLVRVLAAESVSDAGAFYASETYILPSDKGGITNHIIVTEDNAEMIEKGNDYEAVNQKYKITLHKWDGVKLIKVK